MGKEPPGCGDNPTFADAYGNTCADWAALYASSAANVTKMVTMQDNEGNTMQMPMPLPCAEIPDNNCQYTEMEAMMIQLNCPSTCPDGITRDNPEFQDVMNYRSCV